MLITTDIRRGPGLWPHRTTPIFRPAPGGGIVPPRVIGQVKARPLPVPRTPKRQTTVDPKAPWNRSAKRTHFRRLASRGVSLAGLDGLGNFLKKVSHAVTKIAVAPIRLVSTKLADNIVKASDKIHDVANDAVNSVAKAARRNWKWVAAAAAVAITIYSMGTGATLAAKMMSGSKALAAAIGKGAVKVGSAVKGVFTGGTAAASAGTTAGTAAAGTAAAGASSSALMTYGPMALTVSNRLLAGAKASELSTEERQAYAAMAEEGYLPMNTELQRAMGLSGQNAGNLDEDSEEPTDGSRSGRGRASSNLPSWVIPAAIAGGALALVMVLKK